MFETDEKLTFAQREEQIIAFWESEEIFEKSLSQRQGAPVFSFYDGPPFATGLPHYGHILAGTIKDVVPRYKAMQGFFVPRRFGWDCHGLPVENEVEKAKELAGAPSIKAFGVGKFNEECRSIVLRYSKEWEHTVQRMGRWVDFEKGYRTMDPDFMESVWWVFAELYARGLVYEGFKVMPFSAQLGTPLSNFEANLNYRDVDDPSLTVTFPLVDDPKTAFLVWTTTPWTLPSNLALVVAGEGDYVKVREKKSGKQYLLGKGRLSSVFPSLEEVEVVEEMKGKELADLRYQPIFPYFIPHGRNNAFRVLLDDAVSSEEGTGVLHAAPAFGEVDFFICSREGIELVCPVDQNGKFTEEVPDFAGLFVKDADKEIIKRLKGEGRVFHHGQIHHRYPFCWRSDTPLLYKAVRTWFVAVEKIKERLLAANAKIRWVPEHIKEGRFGKWLESARDWAVSRNRYWGTPIPLWRSADGEVIVIGSVKELEERTGQKITDLHCHYIDQLTFVEKGKVFHRIPEVFDCWFESGSMPYAQRHYPFENKEELQSVFPADFIAEGIDQTRGWFYTLTVLSTALFDEPAFKNVIVNGIILAEDGTKMSKRLKNYPEPERMFNEYGADAVRLYLLQSPAMKGEDVRFTEPGVELILRQALIPLWNSYVFFATYAKIYAWEPSSLQLQAPIDRWILSRLQKVIQEVTTAMDNYSLNEAVEPFVGFIEQVTNWYIRRSRPRFWADEDTADRREAFATLYTVLLTLTKIVAPFIPFLSEAIYCKLRTERDPQSVHLCDFPTYQSALRDIPLEEEMAAVQTVVNLGHALRKEHRLKVRQPLQRAHVAAAEKKQLSALSGMQQLIVDELNVKEVIFHPSDSAFVQLNPKPNFRILGKKVGKLMSTLQKTIAEFSQGELQVLLEGGEIEVFVGEEKILLTPEDVAVERKILEGLVAATAGGITVGLDTELNETLLREGLARELINKINTMRRDEGYAVSDRIEITLQTTEKVESCFTQYRDYICHEVLATEVLFGVCEGTAWDVNGEPTTISLRMG